MELQLLPNKLTGSIDAIESKSHAQRVLISTLLAELSEEDPDIKKALSQIKIKHLSKDIRVVRNCLLNMSEDEPVLDCAESGAALRFMLPVAMALKNKVTFNRGPRLAQRPLTPLIEQMKIHGCSFSEDPETHSLTVTGSLTPGEYFLPGNISTQFISGLIFALPLLEGKSSIELTEEPQTLSYVDLTINVVEAFEIEILSGKTPEKKHIIYAIEGGQKYRKPSELPIEGDWSNISLWLTANSIGSNITCHGININSKQGDKAILDVLAIYDNIGSPYDKGDPIVVDAALMPDLIPIIGVKAGLTPRITRVINAEKLAYKESDRLKSTSEMLEKLGAFVRITPDGLIIKGVRKYNGAVINGYKDHRIVMAAAIAATSSDKPIIITDAESVKKSYPDFFTDYISLGGKVKVRKKTND